MGRVYWDEVPAMIDLPPQDDGVILSRAHYDALLARGNALAAAVEDYVFVGPRREYERARDRMVEAARAWRAAREAPSSSPARTRPPQGRDTGSSPVGAT